MTSKSVASVSHAKDPMTPSILTAPAPRRSPHGFAGRFVRRRSDAKVDTDGHCTVCGYEIREYEGGTDAEALRRHVCPPVFRMVSATNK